MFKSSCCQLLKKISMPRNEAIDKELCLEDFPQGRKKLSEKLC